jgi:hypothetical protein
MSKHASWLIPTTLVCLATGVVGLSHSLRTPVSLHAMTAHGSERKTLVTVPLDAGIEAVVSLDHITGELTGYVLDRFSGNFFVQYRYNVANDFPLRPGKKPRFLMVAGLADFQQFTSNERVGDGVVYVAEEGSGQVVAYAMPWNRQFRTSTAGPQQLQFIPLDRAKTRFANIPN